MATLRDAIIAIQTHALTAGAREAPNDPPEGNAGFPFSVCYPSSGVVKAESANARRDLVNLFLDYHVSHQNLPLNVQKALAFFETFPTLLINDPTLGGAVDTVIFETGIAFVFGEMEYASVKTIGFRFTIAVKMRRIT